MVNPLVIPCGPCQYFEGKGDRSSKTPVITGLGTPASKSFSKELCVIMLTRPVDPNLYFQFIFIHLDKILDFLGLGALLIISVGNECI